MAIAYRNQLIVSGEEGKLKELKLKLAGDNTNGPSELSQYHTDTIFYYIVRSSTAWTSWHNLVPPYLKFNKKSNKSYLYYRQEWKFL